MPLAQSLEVAVKLWAGAVWPHLKVQLGVSPPPRSLTCPLVGSDSSQVPEHGFSVPCLLLAGGLPWFLAM